MLTLFPWLLLSLAVLFALALALARRRSLHRFVEARSACPMIFRCLSCPPTVRGRVLHHWTPRPAGAPGFACSHCPAEVDTLPPGEQVDRGDLDEDATLSRSTLFGTVPR